MRHCAGCSLLGLLVASALASPVRAATATQRPAPPPAAAAPTDTALAFQGATVVDVRTGRLWRDRTIVVVGNRVQAVGPADHTSLPPGARVVQARGTYAIPGLWDMHVHPFQYAPGTFYPLFIANGVTGVREMHTPFLDSVLTWRREILAGKRVGPRFVTPGPWLGTVAEAKFWNGDASGIFGGRPTLIGLATREDARRVVDSLKQAGVDFIKVRDFLSRDVYFAVAREARRLGLPLAGHLPDSVTAAEASDSGQRSIEHWIGREGCRVLERPVYTAADSSFDPAACKALAARFLRNGTWFSTAGAICGYLTSCQSVMRYWPDAVLQSWSVLPATAGLTEWAADDVASRTHFGAMRRAGIRFLVGTDTGPIAFLVRQVPGFSLHDTLWYFVRGGLTPLEALQAATLNPAEYLHATDSLGTIAPGKIADLVFLDANPLVDIYNTRRIRAVVANGRFFDRSDLDQLLLEVEQRARGGKQP